MKLTTSKNKEYTVSWAGQSLTKSREMLIQMPEIRPLVKLIEEFDGIEWAKTSGPDGQPDREFAGPMHISAASRLENGNVLITLEMEAASE